MVEIVTGQDRDSRSGTWPDALPKPALPDDDKLLALVWARRALSEAWGRCGNSKSDAFASWTAAVEGVWWSLAIDDSLTDLHPSYTDLRDNDQYGQVVAAFKWIRNRHAHELFITGQGGPKRNFYAQPGDDYVFYISPSNRWKKSADVRADFDRDRKGELKRAYDTKIAGLPLDMSLHHCGMWFDRIFSAWGLPRSIPVDDPTVLR